MGLASAVPRQHRARGYRSITCGWGLSSRRCSRGSRISERWARAVLLVIKENWREIALSTLLRTGQLVPHTFSPPTSSATAPRSRLASDDARVPVAPLADLHRHDPVCRPHVRPLRPQEDRRNRAGRHRIVLVSISRCWRRRRVAGVPGDGHRLGAAGSVMTRRRPRSSPRTSRLRRYSGSGLGYHLASITAGGPARSSPRRGSAHFARSPRHCRVRPGQRAHQPGDAAGPQGSLRRPGSHVSSGEFRSDGCQMGV